MIAGTFRFTCGEETFDAPVGTVVTLPPHVPHSWISYRLCYIRAPGGLLIGLAEELAG